MKITGGSAPGCLQRLGVIRGGLLIARLGAVADQIADVDAPSR